MAKEIWLAESMTRQHNFKNLLMIRITYALNSAGYDYHNLYRGLFTVSILCDKTLNLKTFNLKSLILNKWPIFHDRSSFLAMIASYVNWKLSSTPFSDHLRWTNFNDDFSDAFQNIPNWWITVPLTNNVFWGLLSIILGLYRIKYNFDNPNECFQRYFRSMTDQKPLAIL